jgi:hypothetical protein
MNVLVISQTHDLIPVAWRLLLEGNDVSLIVLQDSAESAWSGQDRLPRRMVGADKRDEAKCEQLIAELVQAGTVVLTDSRRWAERLRPAGVTTFGPMRLEGTPEDRPNPPPVTIGAWFNGAEVSAQHLVVSDPGLWHPHLGPRLTGGLTLVAPRAWPAAFETALAAAIPRLRDANYQGLVRLALRPSEDGSVPAGDLYLGWGWLHTHAFISELGDRGPGLGGVLAGEAAEFPSTFTVVLPVSMAPWPGRIDARGGWPQVEVPAAARKGDVFFHGIAFGDGKVWTGVPAEDADGGLVGVARGSAATLGLARGRALEQAAILGEAIPDPQFRPDVGGSVEEVLATLERQGLGIL